uniref:Uncharacterized protein n=1 Tax=Arundo donax TaxID=35708 RepID=A0A0A8YJ26_ARUDO
MCHICCELHRSLYSIIERVKYSNKGKLRALFTALNFRIICFHLT